MRHFLSRQPESDDVNGIDILVRCINFQYMRATLTVSLPEDLSEALTRMVERKGTSRSQVVQDALRRQIALERFRDLRDRLVPKAGQAGFHSDEDVFEAIS